MPLPRRKFLQLIACTSVLSGISQIAGAQVYPARPVHLIVPFTPGGTTDIVARLVGRWLSERLGQSIIVENRPGAGTNVGTEVVVNAALSISVATLRRSRASFGQPTLWKSTDRCRSTPCRNSSPCKGQPGKDQHGVVRKRNGKPFDLCKGQPGKDQHGIHVPYRGAAPALVDLIAGQVQVQFASAPETIEYIRNGKLQAIGVTTSTRSVALPEIPAIGEFVSGYETSAWWGLCAPKNTPAAIIERLSNETNAALADPAVKARLATLGADPMVMGPVEFGKLIVDETEKWAKVIKFAGVKAE